MDCKIKHLEFIQGVINRLASNLFLLKGWTITLIAALFALAAKDSNRDYAVLAYLPIFVFWILDGYFLSLERQYRDLYEAVAKTDPSNIDFFLSTKAYQKNEGRQWYSAMFAWSLSTYYVPLALVAWAVWIWVPKGVG